MKSERVKKYNALHGISIADDSSLDRYLENEAILEAAKNTPSPSVQEQPGVIQPPRLWVVKRYVVESYDVEAYSRLDAITRSYEKGDPFDVEIKKETAKLKRSV